MTISLHDFDGSAAAVSPAQALYAAENLPFPPIPEQLVTSLKAQGPSWYATRLVTSTPYDLEHFSLEVETQPDLPDYAVVGFDGFGTNSWAAHYYVVNKSLALFIQLPWGGAYTEPVQARQDIAAMVDWAAKLQSKLEQAELLHRIPQGVRLEVIASRFGRAGWRWIGGGLDAATIPWNSPAGMLDAMLSEVDELADGRRSFQAKPEAS
ncbi:hypothetical protein [Variovorax sp. 770b2]|uniref:hypothetical protein n=1 Tax=Variovorax sp. 770b2 TaxID=1566271 RepID=UPI0008E7BE3F|nr:hypothetical protein [Variovorax sp. 770b2]SFQ03601.1 hypothetical protein SAMN03159339_5231 [Variovorax sp. 770b2]